MGESMIELSDQDILSRLTNTEDSTVERKTASDYRDCRKTAVAFSNSLPVDDPGIIFVGVGNDGTVQDNPNLDSLQKEEINKVYPPIYPQIKVMWNTDGKEFLAVIVRGSAQRPHFAGPSYIRDGTQTKEASEQQFERLIAERNSKAREILKWRGKEITLACLIEMFRPGSAEVVVGRREMRTVIDCNQFYAILEEPSSGRLRESFPLAELEIGFDDKGNRLELRVKRR
jgi:hypothetical protein